MSETASRPIGSPHGAIGKAVTGGQLTGKVRSVLLLFVFTFKYNGIVIISRLNQACITCACTDQQNTSMQYSVPKNEGSFNCFKVRKAGVFILAAANLSL